MKKDSPSSHSSVIGGKSTERTNLAQNVPRIPIASMSRDASALPELERSNMATIRALVREVDFLTHELAVAKATNEELTGELRKYMDKCVRLSSMVGSVPNVGRLGGLGSGRFAAEGNMMPGMSYLDCSMSLPSVGHMGMGGPSSSIANAGTEHGSVNFSTDDVEVMPVNVAEPMRSSRGRRATPYSATVTPGSHGSLGYQNGMTAGGQVGFVNMNGTGMNHMNAQGQLNAQGHMPAQGHMSTQGHIPAQASSGRGMVAQPSSHQGQPMGVVTSEVVTFDSEVAVQPLKVEGTTLGVSAGLKSVRGRIQTPFPAKGHMGHKDEADDEGEEAKQ